MTGKRLGLIDSHAHLDFKAFDGDREEVLGRAWETGLEAVINICVAEGLAGVEAGLAIADLDDRIFATVGVHPHDVQKMQPEWFDTLKAMAARPGVVAVGETGLDFHYMHSPRVVQIECFERFLGLARALDLPAVIHTREADDETLAVLDRARSAAGGTLRGVVHCFSGDYGLATRLLDMGLYLSFTGVITFPKAQSLREVVARVPLERILLETDSPYLTPVPRRGRRNEPAYVAYVAETVATLHARPVEAIADTTSRNVADLFRIPL